MTTPGLAVTKNLRERILFSFGGFSWEDTLVIDPDDLSQSPLWNLKTLRLSSRPSPIAPTVNTVIGSLLGHSHTKTRARCQRVDDEHFHLENKTFCSRLLLWHFVSFARYYFGWPACCDFSCNSDSLHIPACFDNYRLVVLQTGSFGGLFGGFDKQQNRRCSFWFSQLCKQQSSLPSLCSVTTTPDWPSCLVLIFDNFFDHLEWKLKTWNPNMTASHFACWGSSWKSELLLIL